jgi:hypothetical protein
MATVADDIERAETSPIVGGRRSSPGCPRIFSCTVSGFCGCMRLGKSMFVIMALDFCAFILLCASAALCLVEGGCLAVANAVFVTLGAIFIGCAIFVRDAKVANLLIWLAFFFHALFTLLCFVGWIWQVGEKQNQCQISFKSIENFDFFTKLLSVFKIENPSGCQSC